MAAMETKLQAAGTSVKDLIAHVVKSYFLGPRWERHKSVASHAHYTAVESILKVGGDVIF